MQPPSDSMASPTGDAANLADSAEDELRTLGSATAALGDRHAVAPVVDAAACQRVAAEFAADALAHLRTTLDLLGDGFDFSAAEYAGRTAAKQRVSARFYARARVAMGIEEVRP